MAVYFLHPVIVRGSEAISSMLQINCSIKKIATLLSLLATMVLHHFAVLFTLSKQLSPLSLARQSHSIQRRN